MRIDNRSFDILIHEERSGKLRSDEGKPNKVSRKASVDKEFGGVGEHFSKFEAVPTNLRNNGRSSMNHFNPRNSQDNFFTDNDFDFGGNGNSAAFNRKSSMPIRVSRTKNNEDKFVTNSFANFNEFNNKFSSGRQSVNPGTNQNSSNRVNNPLLVDVNDIYSDSKKPTVTDSKEILNSIKFDLTGEEVFRQNQNALKDFDASKIGGGNVSSTDWMDKNTNVNFGNLNSVTNLIPTGSYGQNNVNSNSNIYTGSNNLSNNGNNNGFNQMNNNFNHNFGGNNLGVNFTNSTYTTDNNSFIDNSQSVNFNSNINMGVNINQNSQTNPIGSNVANNNSDNMNDLKVSMSYITFKGVILLYSSYKIF